MQRLPSAWIHAIRETADLVVGRQWDALVSRGLVERQVTPRFADDCNRTLDLYPGTFVRIPDEAIVNAWVEPDRRLGPATDGSLFYDVDLRFFTAEEGQTDLTLSLSVYESDDGKVIAKLNDILVR